jgi:hypothetical protein
LLEIESANAFQLVGALQDLRMTQAATTPAIVFLVWTLVAGVSDNVLKLLISAADWKHRCRSF